MGQQISIPHLTAKLHSQDNKIMALDGRLKRLEDKVEELILKINNSTDDGAGEGDLTEVM